MLDHFELLEATLRGDPTTAPPVTLWRHWPVADQSPQGLAGAMVSWQAAYDFDLVKFMPSGTYGVEDWGVRTTYVPTVYGNRTITGYAVTHPEDWANLRHLDPSAGTLGKQNEALALTAHLLDGSVPILQTVFSPLTTAFKLAGDRLWQHLREAPDAVLAGLETITSITLAFSRQALAAGASGVFLANQTSNTPLLSDADFEAFAAPFDIALLHALSPHSRFTAIHLHGNDVRFESIVRRYACNMISWHDRHTYPSIAQARALTDKVLVGGLQWDEALASHPVDRLRDTVSDARQQSGDRRWILAPGCVCPLDLTDEQIRHIVRKAREPRAVCD